MTYQKPPIQNHVPTQNHIEMDNEKCKHNLRDLIYLIKEQAQELKLEKAKILIQELLDELDGAQKSQIAC